MVDEGISETGLRIQVPIFPLPSSILFPGVFVPLHIFEERYKKMLAHIEQGTGEVAISFAPETGTDKVYPNKICGVGSVRVLKRAENGEADILVFGTKRVRFDKYIQEIPFLIGEGEVLAMDRVMPEKTQKALLTEVREMLISWIFSNLDAAGRLIQFFKLVEDLEPLCNFVAYYMLTDMEKKQALLEESSLEAKAQKVWQILKDAGAGESEASNAAQTAAASNIILFPDSGMEDSKKPH